MLQEWANTSQTLSSVAQPQMSKSLLKQEFEKLKPKILMKLESIQTGDYSSDISG
jgi:serine/threonine-protein kinase